MVPSNLLLRGSTVVQTVKCNAISLVYCGQICFRVLCFTIIRQKLGCSVDQAILVISPLLFGELKHGRCGDATIKFRRVSSEGVERRTADC